MLESEVGREMISGWIFRMAELVGLFPGVRHEDFSAQTTNKLVQALIRADNPYGVYLKGEDGSQYAVELQWVGFGDGRIYSFEARDYLSSRQRRLYIAKLQGYWSPLNNTIEITNAGKEMSRREERKFLIELTSAAQAISPPQSPPQGPLAA